MPLANKKPFVPKPIPDNLGPDDEVLYHALTNEIFTNHDAYFDRFLYCNSLIWTCCRTGKSGLTYEEALISERSTGSPSKKNKGAPKATKKNHKTSDGGGNGGSTNDDQSVKKKKKKYPYDPKKYAMPVPEGFDPSLLTPTGKIDGRKLKSKRNLQLAEELLNASGYQPKAPTSGGKRGKSKSDDADSKKKDEETRKKEEEAKKKQEEARKKLQQAELAKERELEARRKKEAAAQAKQLERQKKLEEQKRAAAFLQNWEKKCEDLERDDLRRLPQPTPVNCEIPEKLFGDSLYIMEAVYNFHDLYTFSEIYSDGLSFDTLEEILLDKDEGGALGTLLQFLLQVIFRTQPTQDGYGLDDDTTRTIQHDNTNSATAKDVKKENLDIDEDTNEYDHNGMGISERSEDDENDENNEKYVNMNDRIGSAIKAAQELRKTFTKPLPEMELTQANVTEILRLHLLQSGSFPKGRTIYNGWYSSREDPGLWLCMEEPDLMKKLGEVTIYDLEIEERIKILHTLINQLLTFIKSRSYMEAASDQLLELRKLYRKEAADFARWDRENCVKRMQPPKKKNDQLSEGPGEDETKNSGAMDENGMDVDGDVNHNPHANHNGGATGDDQVDQSYEELERAYQQNKVDYEDYQRERAIRHEQLTGILLELRNQLRSNQSVYAIHPIGRDRAYRRYWLFQSLPGLFVEQDDEFVGRCLPNPTPLESRYKKLFGKDNPLMHPNEADLIRPKTCDVACSTEEPTEDGLVIDEVKKPVEEQEDGFVMDEMNYCTGDETTCYIHGPKRPTQRWWFYHTAESIDRLIECLNKRGYRESELHDVLSTESSIIKPYIAECPAYKLNRTILELSGIRRSRRLRTKTGKRRGKKYDQE